MSEKDKFIKSFEEKLKTTLSKKELNSIQNGADMEEISSNSMNYETFRKEAIPLSSSIFEKWCNFFEKYLKIEPDKKSKKEIDEKLKKSHIHATSTGVMSLSVGVSLVFLIIGLLLFAVEIKIFGVAFLIIGTSLFFILQNIPSILEKQTKAQANSQIIIAIFYIVAFMRFSSNFERAVEFAASYLNAPLSLDFKKILWELENQKYSNIKKAFDVYLDDWRDENLEYLEAIYLIESSLYEGEEFRRISLLDKALDIILKGNYEKMLHYSQELKGSVSTFNMLGVVLPILGLIILPLAASMGNPKAVFQIVVVIYNIILPASLAYFGFLISTQRPASFNSIKIPKGEKLKNLNLMTIKLSDSFSFKISLLYYSMFIGGIFLLIGLLPIIIENANLTEKFNTFFSTIITSNSPFASFSEYKTIEVEGVSPYVLGPYGIYPALLSIFIPLSFAFGIGTYLKEKYKNLIKLRDETKKLENQFPSALFQLGNRINDGISSELAFGSVAETMKGTSAGNFFSEVDKNIKFDGLGIEAAIFDNEKGAINKFPSEIVVSCMKVFVKASNKGPEVSAKTLIDLSKYLSEIHLGSERMKDLLSESVGSMKSQVSFLAPVISAIVISIVYLVSVILSALSKSTAAIEDSSAGVDGGVSNFLGDSIPTYLFQTSVGVYIVFLVIILIYVTDNLDNGDDPINTRYSIGEKLQSAIKKYSIITGLGIIAFGFVGASILESLV